MTVPVPSSGYAPTARPVSAAPARAPGSARAVLALAGRDLAEGRRMWAPLLLDIAYGVVNLALFLVISRVLTPKDGLLGASPHYFDFVAVGITFMLVVQTATSQVAGRVAQEQRDGTLELLTVQPVSAGVLAVGLAAYPFLVALLRAALYLVVLALLFGLDVGEASGLGVALILLAGAAAMMGVGIALMAVTVVTGRGDVLARLLLVALSFVSGAYFPVTALPGVPAALTAVLPSRVAIDGLRQALAGDPWGAELLLLTGGVAVLLPASVWLFDRALRSARRRGRLTRI
ncbi:ABC transporter permease [Micromonospora mirobrigensis]|uniref:Transport permease protein n=1 Tax=Micromonospora mirobrigensis TaxID=262898 RepID=A0A1C4Z507_9ACTN|nr:ABC transporter permease [Micromonospora mirobrigensis]SCF27967.1 ABC-2 type transport system permease protein [Micromonospora mirobrigensis]